MYVLFLEYIFLIDEIQCYYLSSGIEIAQIIFSRDTMSLGYYVSGNEGSGIPCPGILLSVGIRDTISRDILTRIPSPRIEYSNIHIFNLFN